jgi:uncharacterized protein YbbC (DUF1343 family)
MMASGEMLLGLELLERRGHPWIDHARIGLLANPASVNRDLVHAWQVIDSQKPGQITAIFTPQHGFWGDAQANMIETEHGWHQSLDVPVYSLYSETRRPTSQMLEKIDCLVVDLQDVGTRIYTFAWTLLECMRACAEANVSMLILDRPNPLGGCIIEGPMLSRGCQSFVGGTTIPMRHGLTIAELGRLFQRREQLDLALETVAMESWCSDSVWKDLGRAWIPPSPNLPTSHSVRLYPGQVLLEGTNLSEGRGTTVPFEMIGAPFIDAEILAAELQQVIADSVRVLPACFRPTFDKWAGELCGGISIHVVEPDRFRSFSMTIHLLAEIQRLYPSGFRWLDPPYEYEFEKQPIDILYGNEQLRLQLGDVEPSLLSAAPNLVHYREDVGESMLYSSDETRFRE